MPQFFLPIIERFSLCYYMLEIHNVVFILSEFTDKGLDFESFGIVKNLETFDVEPHTVYKMVMSLWGQVVDSHVFGCQVEKGWSCGG